MKITRANVEKHALAHGLQPVQIDGIPDGFAWKACGITIGDRVVPDKIIKFKPLADWAEYGAITYE